MAVVKQQKIIIMKKYLFVLGLLIASILNANAVKIESDVINSDGTRTIFVTPFNIYTGMTNAAAAQISVMEVDFNGNRIPNYFIKLFLNEGIFEVKKGSKLLIKLESDEVIELEAFYDVEKDIRMIRSGSVEPSYGISKENLLKLSTGKAVKIRIETEAGIKDRQIKGNKLSKGVLESTTLINKALKDKKDIYSDF